MKTIIISRHGGATQVATIADGRLDDYSSHTSARDESIVGSIFKGSVASVSTAAQCCFIDIGMEKNAALYACDAAYLPAGHATRPIDTLLRAGAKAIVQATRDASGSKGARVTAKISLPGSLIVLLPGSWANVSVSSKIKDRRERARLREAVKGALPDEGFSAIVRTESEGAKCAQLAEEVAALLRVWDGVMRAEREGAIPSRIYERPGLLAQIAACAAKNDVSRVVSDDRLVHEELAVRAADGSAHKFELYSEPYPIFAFYGVSSDIQSISSREVRLKCGAKIVIDRAEALTAVDVNSASVGGRRRPEEAILRTNIEAAVETARQLRFRDIGGIIVIDAIRMRDKSHYDAVVAALEAELRKDARRTTVAGVTRLGLIELSRAY